MSTVTPPNPALTSSLTSSLRNPVEDRQNLKDRVQQLRESKAEEVREPTETKTETERTREVRDTAPSQESGSETRNGSQGRGSYLDISV